MNKQIRKSLVIAVAVVLLLLLAAPAALASGGNYHKVHYGETLYSIGRAYGVNPHRIADANDLYNPDYIYAGQVLYVPAGGYYDDGYGYHDDYNND